MPTSPKPRHEAVSLGFVAALIAAVVACALAAPATGLAAEIPPHVSASPDGDACAMCHRGHSSASDIPTVRAVTGPRGNALAVGIGSGGSGDAQLCYACHGVDSLGSTHNVQGEFLSGPGHSLAPTTSAYGPADKQCSDCHDAHGSAKRSDGSPYPALLRARNRNGGFVYSGEEYCITCHTVRKSNEFPGQTLWDKTAHASIALPGSGTGIVCSTCHTPHGSSNAPNVVTTLAPPSVASTVTVSANDRTFCQACHPTKSQTWPGTTVYATSAHASSSATVAADGEWAKSGVSRRVGECQSCHAPMGAADAAGRLVPRLAREVGATLCYDCHNSTGPAQTDLESLAYRPAPVVSAVAGFGSAPTSAQFGAVRVYTRDATASPQIGGPRQFLTGPVGAMAAGDVEGIGASQLVVARPGSSKVTLLSHSDFEGLYAQPGDRTLLAPASFVSVADVLDDPYSRAELITADGGTVRVYRWDTGTANFVAVTAVTLPGTISGLATGHILSSTREDIALTTQGPDRLVVLTQDTPTSLAISGSYGTRALPCAPSVGDLNGDGHGEIAVANSGELSPTLSVYSELGTELMTAGSTADASPTATAIGDILPGVTQTGTSGLEVALTLGSASGSERVEVYPRDTLGLAAPETHTFDAHSQPDAATVGDVDGDGRDELLVALAGLATSSPTDATPPGLAIVHASADGTTLGTVDVRSAGGVELAGASSVVAADLGAIGPSRHPVEAATDAHVSTETAPFAEHVACADCHNVHEATAAAATAPAMPGVELGAWGVTVGGSNPTLDTSITQESQLCFKCHAAYSGASLLSGVRPVDAEFDTGNPSFHPVEGTSPATNGTGDLMVSGWTSSSRVNCSDCHGNSDGRGSATSGQPNGPHASPSAPLLARPLLDAKADDSSALCYSCHLESVYSSGVNDDQATQSSGFIDSAGTNPRQHSLHTSLGITCSACHVAHGSATEPYGLRSDIGWSPETGGGSCDGACHASATQTYTR